MNSLYGDERTIDSTEAPRGARNIPYTFTPEIVWILYIKSIDINYDVWLCFCVSWSLPGVDVFRGKEVEQRSSVCILRFRWLSVWLSAIQQVDLYWRYRM